jgi:putative transposase
VARRWAAHHQAQAAALAAQPGGALIPPGHLVAARPLQLVQIDHTQADVFVVDEVARKTIGRPWLTVAIDIATRCILAVYLSMERPNTATVALLLTRVALPKAPWLASLGLGDIAWPMHGLPQTLHLDNAAEFKGRSLRSGCREYGIDLRQIRHFESFPPCSQYKPLIPLTISFGARDIVAPHSPSFIPRIPPARKCWRYDGSQNLPS